MIQRIKQHIQRHRETYRGVAIGAGAVSAAVVVVAASRNETIVFTKAYIRTGRRSTVNSVLIELVEKSTPNRPVHLVGTDRYFSSLNEAARQTGHNLSMISRQVNGHIPSVHGDVFELLTVES